MMSVLPEVGSVLKMIPATSGTSASIINLDRDPERQYVLTVIGYAVVVDAAWEDGGVVRYSTSIEPVVIRDDHVATVRAYLDGRQAYPDELRVEPS
jgi:hypothetical protein